MKKIVALLFAVLCLGLSGAFAQSRRANPDESGEKANKRPPLAAPSPTPVEATAASPIVIETERNESNNAADDSEVIRVDTNLVTIPVKVSDRKNRFVAGLAKEDFKVWEDNVEQEIALFSNERQPFTRFVRADERPRCDAKSDQTNGDFNGHESLRSGRFGIKREIEKNRRTQSRRFIYRRRGHDQPQSARSR
jgi:hypothetical protein